MSKYSNIIHIDRSIPLNRVYFYLSEKYNIPIYEEFFIDKFSCDSDVWFDLDNFNVVASGTISKKYISTKGKCRLDESISLDISDILIDSFKERNFDKFPNVLHIDLTISDISSLSTQVKVSEDLLRQWRDEFMFENLFFDKQTLGMIAYTQKWKNDTIIFDKSFIDFLVRMETIDPIFIKLYHISDPQLAINR